MITRLQRAPIQGLLDLIWLSLAQWGDAIDRHYFPLIVSTLMGSCNVRFTSNSIRTIEVFNWDIIRAILCSKCHNFGFLRSKFWFLFTRAKFFSFCVKHCLNFGFLRAKYRFLVLQVQIFQFFGEKLSKFQFLCKKVFVCWGQISQNLGFFKSKLIS